MKSLIVIFLLIFSTLDVNAFQVFGGGAASTLEGQNGAYYLDLSNHTGDLPPSSFDNISATSITLTDEINTNGLINSGITVFPNDTTVFSDYSALNNPYIIFGNSSTVGPFSIYLDAMSNYIKGQEIRISKIDSSVNNITIVPAGGDTLAGDSSIVFAAKGDALTLHNDGTTDWKILQRAVATEAGSAQLHVDNEDGIFYPLSTTFRDFTSFDGALTSTTVVANLGAQSVDINETGRYNIFTHVQGEGLSGTLVEAATFLNITSEIDEVGSVVPAGALHFPAFLNVSVGTISSGSIADLTAADGNNLIVDEINGVTPGAAVIFRFDDVIAPASFHWEESAYDGTVGHNQKVKVLNAVLITYTSLTDNTTDLPNTGASLSDVYTRDFRFPSPIQDYVNANGEVFVLVDHVSTGSPGDTNIYDKIFVSDAFSTANLSTSTFADLNAGDVLTLKLKDGLNGIFKVRHGGLKVHRIGGD